MTGPESPTVPALLRRAAEHAGAHTYVVEPGGRLTYAEADDRSAAAACWLLGIGVGKGSRVGLFFPNGVDWVIWWLAASRIGAVVVPLSTMYRPAEIAKVLRLSDVGVLVAPSRILDFDVADRLEAALPELTGRTGGALAVAAAPYLRHIVMTGETGRPWATRVRPADAVPAELLPAAVSLSTP